MSLKKLNSNRKKIIEFLYDGDSLNHYYKRILKNNPVVLYLIKKETNFLDDDEASIRERIFYIENEIFEKKCCEICNIKKAGFNNSGSPKIYITCGSKMCLNELKSRNMNMVYKNMSEEERNRTVVGLRKYTKYMSGKSYEEIYGEEKANEMKKKLSDINIGKKQSEETKLKRVKSRKNSGKSFHTEKSRKKMSKSMKIKWKDPNYRKVRSEISERNKPIQSLYMKEKIKSGEFTPNITNSWTHWNFSHILKNGKVIKFRSSWEYAFWIIKSKDCEIEYEKTRIEYKLNGEKKIYITDFTDEKNRVIYEIKPKSNTLSKKFSSKVKFAEEWCKRNDYTFKIISEDWFSNNIEKINFHKHSELKKHMGQFICQ